MGTATGRHGRASSTNGPSAGGTTVTGPGRRRTTIVRAMTTLGLPLSQARARRRPRTGNRTLRRLTSDPQMLLGVGLVATTVAVGAIGSGGDPSRVLAISVLFVAAQALAVVAAPYLQPSARQRAIISFGRFSLAIVYVTVATALLRSGEFRPTGALYIPIVALAAAQGARQAMLIGAAAVALYLTPVLLATQDSLTLDAQRAIALGGTAILLSIEPRR